MTAPGFGDRRQWVLSALDRYELPLTRYALRLLGDEDAARDVVQHAFLRLCGESPRELHGRVAQWLFTVCRNRAVDLLRARGRTEPLARTQERSCISNEPDPAAVVEREDFYRRLNELVGSLPPAQGEVLTLWAEGFTYRQIAETVQKSEGAIRVLVHRALQQLRRHPLVRQWLAVPTDTHRTPQPKPTRLM